MKKLTLLLLILTLIISSSSIALAESSNGEITANDIKKLADKYDLNVEIKNLNSTNSNLHKVNSLEELEKIMIVAKEIKQKQNEKTKAIKFDKFTTQPSMSKFFMSTKSLGANEDHKVEKKWGYGDSIANSYNGEFDLTWLFGVAYWKVTDFDYKFTKDKNGNRLFSEIDNIDSSIDGSSGPMTWSHKTAKATISRDKKSATIKVWGKYLIGVVVADIEIAIPISGTWKFENVTPD